MKVSIQSVINGALAISVTLLIYQNNQLKDNIEALEDNAQLGADSIIKFKENRKDIDSLLERLKWSDEYQTIQDNRHTELTETLTKWQQSLENELNNRIINSENIEILIENQKKLLSQFDIVEQNLLILDGNIKDNNRRIEIIREYFRTQ